LTDDDALAEFLSRIGSASDGSIFIAEEELRRWPAKALAALKSVGFLIEATPASSVVCPGCEQQCVMLVHVPPGSGANAFVVCDKRNDINRVAVEIDGLARWRGSGEAVAALLAKLLGLRWRGGVSAQSRRWEVGMFKTRKRSSHLVLTADGELKLTLAGHTVALSDVLSLGDEGFMVDKGMLSELADDPVSGGGDRESASQRKARLAGRIETLKREGNRDFLRRTAGEEGITISRLKQIVGPRNPHNCR
jgi:hypothetical protein